MMLALSLIVLFITGLLCMCMPAHMHKSCKAIAIVGLAISLAMTLAIGADATFPANDSATWLTEIKIPWIPSWQVNFHLAIDSFAYWLIIAIILMGLLSTIMGSQKINLESAAILWTVFATVGLFSSVDIFLFFIFFELALLPIYWLLFLPQEKLTRSAILRFIIFTQSSGLILLLSVLALSVFHYQSTGQFTFEYREFVVNPLPVPLQHYVFLGFALAFLIKLPAIPFHAWMPAIFARGPVAVILVGILIKVSVFGLIRFSWTIFPVATKDFALPIMVLGSATLIYGAVLAFGQIEAKRVLAYATLSHAGALLIGIFAKHPASFFGVVLLLTASAFSTAAMMIMFDKRSSCANLDDVTIASDLWQICPRFSVALLFMLLASMGFPLLGNFVGEWLILRSTFIEQPIIAIVMSVGIILSAAFSLRLFQKLCLGHASTVRRSSSLMSDLSSSEVVVYGLIALLLITLGLAPSLAIETLDAPHNWPTNSSNHLEVSATKYLQVVSK